MGRLSNISFKDKNRTFSAIYGWVSQILDTWDTALQGSEHNHILVGARAIVGAANPTTANQTQIADYLQKRTRDNTMYGFRGGPAGVTKGKYIKLTDEFVYPYTNQPLLAQEEEQVNDTLQKMLGKGKKVKLEHKCGVVSTTHRPQRTGLESTQTGIWKWDVHNLNGKYLSTEFVVSDEKENVMHCTIKSNISHCFIDKIQEEVVVSVSFCVADVIGYITTVGKSAQPRTRSKTLDFALTNERGHTLRVTLWGKLGDELLKMMSGHCENYTLILTSMSAKYYNSKQKPMSIEHPFYYLLTLMFGPSLPYMSTWHIELFINTYSR
ncbi:nucleic acid-binding, OB-fold protein [Tanacetum coccineum]